MLALQRFDMERRGATPSTGVKSPRAFSGVAAAKPAASALSTVLRMYVLARRCGAGACAAPSRAHRQGVLSTQARKLDPHPQATPPNSPGHATRWPEHSLNERRPASVARHMLPRCRRCAHTSSPH